MTASQRATSRIAHATTLAALTLLTSCAAPPEADHAAAAPTVYVSSQLPWPQRLGPPNHPGVIVPIHDTNLHPGRIGPTQHLNPNPDDQADAKEIAQLGGHGQPVAFRFEGPGSLIFQPAEGVATGEPEYFRFVSACPIQDPTQPGVAAEIQRTWFAYYNSPTPNSPRGLCVLLPGMLATPGPVLDSTTRRLREQGWAILRMLAHPSRFTEHAELTIDYQSDEDAARAAAILTDRVAEAAYATRAALDHVLREDPILNKAPIVALAMSGGAMILPTVLAIEPDRYDAAIYVAGGANFWDIHERSNYAPFINAIDVTWSPEADWRERRAFAQRYLDAAPLDSYHTAPRVDHIPTLMIHATLDRAVPADYGELLWNRLGNPERWSVPVGHELLFVMFPARLTRVSAWLDQHAPAPNTSP